VTSLAAGSGLAAAVASHSPSLPDSAAGTVPDTNGTSPDASATHDSLIAAGSTGVSLIDSGATLQLANAEHSGSLPPSDVIDVTGFDIGASISYSGTIASETGTISEIGHTTVTLKVDANAGIGHWIITGPDPSGTGILSHDPSADATSISVSDDH